MTEGPEKNEKPQGMFAGHRKSGRHPLRNFPVLKTAPPSAPLSLDAFDLSIFSSKPLDMNSACW
jgi:hypothetical protein